MRKYLVISTLFLCAVYGCNDASRQYQGRHPQRVAVADDLKKQGEAMHHEQSQNQDDNDTQDETP